MSQLTQVTPSNKPKSRVLRMKQLLFKLPFTQSHIYALIKAGKFIKPFSLIPGGRSKGWYESDVDDWMDKNMGGQ